MELMEVVQRRRSIRAYKPDPVEPEKIAQILEAARLAPSWKNLQCWRFMIISAAEKRQGIADAFPLTNPGRKAILEAPVVIILCADPDESEVWEGKDYYMLDAGLAMEHLILTATAQGLGTCWQALFSEDKMRSALGVPDNFRIVAITPLGYPAQEKNPRPRKALTEIAFGEQWGQPWS
ncbi:nitroreductase family protein [Paradesulfitobacterium aromaticivorans]